MYSRYIFGERLEVVLRWPSTCTVRVRSRRGPRAPAVQYGRHLGHRDVELDLLGPCRLGLLEHVRGVQHGAWSAETTTHTIIHNKPTNRQVHWVRFTPYHGFNTTYSIYFGFSTHTFSCTTKPILSSPKLNFIDDVKVSQTNLNITSPPCSFLWSYGATSTYQILNQALIRNTDQPLFFRGRTTLSDMHSCASSGRHNTMCWWELFFKKVYYGLYFHNLPTTQATETF